MKKGFTLIELLAVIVILAIIATIATPIVLNIIKDAKRSALLMSADIYLDTVEKTLSAAPLKNISIKDGTYTIMKDGNLCMGVYTNDACDSDILEVKISGNIPSAGSKIIVSKGSVESVSNFMIEGTLFVMKNNNVEIATPRKLNFNFLGVTASNVDYNVEKENATLKITANTWYKLPENITVSNATYEWDRNTGTLLLSGISTDVDITIKGDKIVCIASTQEEAIKQKNSTDLTIGYVKGNVPTNVPLYNSSNPEYTPGVEYKCEVNKGQPITFYVLSSDENSVNFIMASNVRNDGQPINETNNLTLDKHAWYSLESTNSKGPITAMNNLYESTKNWSNISNINIDYSDEGNNYGTITTQNGVATIKAKDLSVTATVGSKDKPLKARLPYLSELQNLKCTTSFGSCPLYLSNYLSQSDYTTNNTYVSGIAGYWTFASMSTNLAWYIDFRGVLGGTYVYGDTQYGTRPVITVLKDEIN